MITLIKNYALALLVLETPTSERVNRGVAATEAEVRKIRLARYALVNEGLTDEQIDTIRENPAKAYCDAAWASSSFGS